MAIDLRVAANRIHGITKGTRAITADTALRLAQYFGNSPEFWLNLQQNYELDRAKREKLDEIQSTIPRRPPTKEEVFTESGHCLCRLGVITQFIGATFMVIYRSTLE